MQAGVEIRDYRDADAAALRQCVIALQEFERAIDPRLRDGEAIADEYCEHIHSRCREGEGRVFVADDGGRVAGFVAVLPHEAFTDLDDPPGCYALVTDIVVLTPSRGKGIGRQLLQRAEAFARHAGATEIRLGVLTKNSWAKKLYRDCGFTPYLEILSKRL